MTTSVFHSTISSTSISKGSRKYNTKESLFSVEVYGEDGDFETFELMAENKEVARMRAESMAQSLMTDICYITVCNMD